LNLHLVMPGYKPRNTNVTLLYWYSLRILINVYKYQNNYLILLISFIGQIIFSNLNDNFSDLQSISAGVYEGLKLGPTLFNIYIKYTYLGYLSNYILIQSPRTNILPLSTNDTKNTTIHNKSRNLEAITHNLNLQGHLNVL